MAYQNGPSVCPRCGSTAEVRTARELFDTMNGAQAQAFQRLSQQFGGPSPYAGPAPQPPGQFPGPGQAPGPAQAASGPGQYSGQPPRAGQYGGQPQRPGQYTADQAPAPGQFPQVQFPQVQFGQGQGSGPGQAQGQDVGQGQAVGQPQPAEQGQTPGQGQGPGQFSGPGQAPGQAPGQGWNRRDDDYDHYNVEGARRNYGRGTDFDLGGNIADDIGGAVLGAALGFAGRAIGRRMKKALEDRVVPAMQARAEQAQQQMAQQQVEQDAIVARYPELRGCMKDQVIFLDGGSRTVAVSELTLPITLAQADAVVARLR